MKILRVFILLYQYAYYFMRERDKRAGMSDSFTKIKAPIIFLIIESWALVSVYLLFDRIILGQPFHKLPSSIPPIAATLAYALVAYCINQWIIGPEGRIHHYREIFDAWDEKKHARWQLYVFSIAVVSLAAFFLVGEISQNGFDPHDLNTKVAGKGVIGLILNWPGISPAIISKCISRGRGDDIKMAMKWTQVEAGLPSC